ncbi:unnamed protein product [Ambrosiozyma monospora]|uniref:Unnamed protein product n=1 Tax=Ambrosiozyma monospora TaxID=43982 RepID=A0ACB5SQX8_AMBMO|nr:unnamed protein product [Ambrosiozyma monospora]
MAPRKSKNQLRRERAKLKKQEQSATTNTNSTSTTTPIETKNGTTATKNNHDIDEEIEIEVSEINPEVLKDPSFSEFKDIFKKFEIIEPTNSSETTVQEIDKNGELLDSDNEDTKGQQDPDDGGESDKDDYDSDDDDEERQLTKRQIKKKYHIPLSFLKAESNDPQLIVPTDADADDPRLFVHLKTLHNAVPIPKHWASKRAFLAGKKGFERPPFELPKFILDTGILEMRDTSGNKEDDTTLKQRMRERVQPKMGQLDIDFNKLYDAFFKYQTKPDLFSFGQVYYEGLEYTDRLNRYKASKFRPGVMSDDLKKALGMLDSKISVPPWSERIKMMGPPPSYPHMKIGPDGSITFNNDDDEVVNIGEAVDKSQYGKLVSESESEDESDDSEDDEGDAKVQDVYVAKEGDVPIESIGDELITADDEKLASDDDDGTEKKLYSVLKEKKSDNGSSIYGSETLAYEIGDKRKRDDTDDESTPPSKSKPVAGNSTKQAKKFHF